MRRTAERQRRISPEAIIDRAASWFPDHELSSRWREEWRADLDELRNEKAQLACWRYAVSIARGTVSLPIATGPRRVLRQVLLEVGQHVLGGAAVGGAAVLAATVPPSSSALIVLVLLLAPFAIRSGLMLVAGFGVGVLCGVLWVSEHVAFRPLLPRARWRLHRGSRS
ncbi:MAG: hypothetical protein ACRDQ5_01680 [Sciscionella sp.]